MRTLDFVSCGRRTRHASIPLHLSVDGSIEVGHEVDIVLTGDAIEPVLPGVLGSLEGVGVPKDADLLAKARNHEVPIHV